MNEEHREYHELANIFPLMLGKKFESFRDDIATNGLLEPITIISDGSIIDGRNRHRACLATGTSPRFVQYTGDESWGALYLFVLSMNSHRRDLESGQRACCAVRSTVLVERLEEEARERRARRPADSVPELIPEQVYGETREQLASTFETNSHYIQDAKKLGKEEPELFEDVWKGKLTLPAAMKKMRAKVIDVERQALAETAATVAPSERWKVLHGDVATIELGERFDFIITDPPYPREFLPLYETLAMRAHDWLKPDGLVVAMCGQSYLDQIVELMGRHLTYYWTAAYLTPGQPTPLRQRQVNCSWKPLLIYGPAAYHGKIFGDVFKSDANDKKHHEWGQSESGMLSIIKQMCLPGQSILDPFCGAGTTGVAALKHGCLFTGIDIDIDKVNMSKGRLG